MQKILKALLPLIIFSFIAAFLLKGLRHNPSDVPPPLLNKAAPAFTAASLEHPDQQITSAIFQGHVTMLNVFASWCLYCRAEHPVLMDIENLKQVQLIGLDYKDRLEKAKAWLAQYGNPYSSIISDPSGKVVITFGVYGTPETFIIDRKGIIRYKHVGPISSADWKEKLLPLIHKLKKEGT